MKKIVTLVLLLVSITFNAQNYSFFENDVRLINSEDQDVIGNEIVTLTHFGFFPISEKFGFTDYASVEGNDQYTYGQVLLGGYYNITDQLSVYLMAGKESVGGVLSQDVRFGYMAYFTTGDKIRTYAFYQRNGNPFSSDTRDTHWYDIIFRYAIASEETHSFYIAARYMRGYGVGLPFIFRLKISEGDSVYVGYTTFYDVDNLLPNSDVLHSITLSFEFF
jgi:hypothetical protein